MQKLINLFRNPIVGVLGSIASVVSVVLAVYFYSASIGERKLTYYVHPAKTSLVSTANTSDFTALYKNSPITGSVSVARIAFWNAGNEPIRKLDILKMLEINTEGGKILEASLTKQSRDVVNIRLFKDRLDDGVLNIDWNVLETNDGAVVQIIYSGGINTPISANAVLVGQKEISQLEYGNEIRTATEQYEHYESQARRTGFIYLAMGGLMVPVLLLFAWLRSRKNERSLRDYFDKSDIFIFLQPVFFIGMSIYQLFFSLPPYPPFGF